MAYSPSADYPQIHVYLAWAYCQKNMLEEAWEEVNTALKLHLRPKDGESASGVTGFAEAYVLMG